MNSTAQKYATALLSLAVVLVTAIIAMPNFSLVSIIQFVILGAGAVVSYIVPLLREGSAWRGGLKTGVAIFIAILTAIVPLIGTAWTPQTIAVIILAALNAAATQLGVAIRVDAATTPVTVNVTQPPALPMSQPEG